MWLLWLVLMIAVAGFFIYYADKKIKIKFEDKFNPHEWDLPRSVELNSVIQPQAAVSSIVSVTLSYEKRPSVLSNTQRHIFNALQQALANEYILLTGVNVGDVLGVNASNALAVQVAAKNLAAKEFDFIVCEKMQLAPVCAIMLGDSLEPLLMNACEEAQLPLARFKIQANYDAAIIRASLLKALGRAEVVSRSSFESALDITDIPTVADGELDRPEQKQPEPKLEEVTVPSPAQKAGLTDSGINLELCPDCSAVMLKRKAKTGAAAGKLFWICSTYPKCRGMLPVK